MTLKLFSICHLTFSFAIEKERAAPNIAIALCQLLEHSNGKWKMENGK